MICAVVRDAESVGTGKSVARMNETKGSVGPYTASPKVDKQSGKGTRSVRDCVVVTMIGYRPRKRKVTRERNEWWEDRW